MGSNIVIIITRAWLRLEPGKSYEEAESQPSRWNKVRALGDRLCLDN